MLRDFSNIKRFKEFYILESRRTSDSRTLLLEDTTLGIDKVDSYRSITYKLAEIFALYGFFFAQKRGFFNEKEWPKLMEEIIKIRDHKSRWDTIVRMSKLLQSKTASPDLKPGVGEFGYRGSYDYGQETEDLPRATEFLRSASEAAFKVFNEEEKKKALEIMDQILRNMQPLRMSRDTSIKEAMKYASPTETDLFQLADSSGNKLMNIYNTLDNLKVAYPDSSEEIDSFLNSSILPNAEKVKTFIQIEIPKVSGSATVGYLKKLQSFDKNVDSLVAKSQELRNRVVKSFPNISSAKQFEDSAMAIITKVRQGILKQAEMNARRVKSGDVVAGTTDIKDPKYSGALGSKSSGLKGGVQKELKKKGIDDLASFLAKKYSLK